MKTIKIVGAGISGLTAAIALQRRGIRAEVFEKNALVGQNVGYNVQAIRNYERKSDFLMFLRRNGLSISARPIWCIKKYAPSGKEMIVRADDKPLFYAIRRGSIDNTLDDQLYHLAIGRGIEVNFNKKNSTMGGNIIATGSLFRNIWAYGGVFKGVNINSQTILFFLDNRYSPQGYIYAIPFGKHEVTIAATSFNLTSPLPILFEKFLNENSIVREMVEGASFENRFCGDAYANYPITAEIKQMKFVGSAAGFIDPARGFGIRYAIESAILVAKSIDENLSYDTLWKKTFGEELLAGLKRRFLLEKLTNDDYEKLIIGGRVNIKRYKKMPFSLSKPSKKPNLKLP
jgi:flavin-dependent dehydrogenase